MEESPVELRAREYRRMMLWVLEANCGAREFYEHLGGIFDGVTRLNKQYGGLVAEGSVLLHDTVRNGVTEPAQEQMGV